MNFGNTVALTAAVGSGSTLEYDEVSGAAKAGWPTVSSMAQPNAPIWGPLNPDLQQASELGYPMYYTPAKYWPKALAEQYFGNKTVFGILRDPYERVLAMFRATGGVARGWQYEDDGRNCAARLNAFVKDSLSPLVFAQMPHPPSPNLHVQADYFEGPYAIQEVLDLDTFPQSANALLQQHGYNVNIQENDMMHVIGCDSTFTDDLDDEARTLIERYYARDFKLRCERLGHCDKKAYHCALGSPGMCPQRLYTWEASTKMYVRK